MSTSDLTPRERDVLELAAAGLTQAEMADQLGLTRGTVWQYTADMRSKLGAKTLAHAVAIAYRTGLLGGAS